MQVSLLWLFVERLCNSNYSKKVPDKSIVPSSVTHLFKVTNKIGVLFTGSLPDSRNLLVRMRQFAGDYYSDYGYEIPVHILADKLAEFAQLYTQEAYMRPLCCISIIFSIDDEEDHKSLKLILQVIMLDIKQLQLVKKSKELLTNLKEKLRKKVN